jgi:hypothetical protein
VGDVGESVSDTCDLYESTLLNVLGIADKIMKVSFGGGGGGVNF